MGRLHVVGRVAGVVEGRGAAVLRPGSAGGAGGPRAVADRETERPVTGVLGAGAGLLAAQVPFSIPARLPPPLPPRLTASPMPPPTTTTAAATITSRPLVVL